MSRLLHPRVAAIVLRTFGWRGLRRRAWHEVRIRLGLFRHAPRHEVSGEVPGAHGYSPSAAMAALPAPVRTRILTRARRVLAGEFEAYGHDWRPLPESPDAWRTHPGSGFAFPDGPWWQVPHLPAQADIKDVWEPARFAWVYDLVRAHAITGEPAFAEAFYARLRGWWTANPPFQGPHWACGQETAIRALAILHGLDALPPPEAAARGVALKVLAASGERIADAIGYALSQRNNHGVSEAAGLVHLGLRFGDAHPEAAAWLRRGRRRLAEQLLDQCAEDGWYAQHSFTYQRVALEQALHAQRALQANGLSLPQPVLARLDAGLVLLAELCGSGGGRVPNHGANDGGRAVPLSSGAYRDFRPLLTLGAVVRGHALPADLAPDPEVLAWLGADAPARTPARADTVRTGPSGWALARVGGTRVFLRAGQYRHRPSHLDPLHLDVRLNEREAITDAGTCAYNAPPPWNNGLSTALVHNGPVLDGREPAERGPRFLWWSWPRARIVEAAGDGDAVRLVAERPGAARREVRVTAHGVTVIDRILDTSASSAQVNWLLHPDALGACRVRATGATTIEPAPDAVDAWFSPTYGARVATQTVRIERPVVEGTTIETVIEPVAGA